MNMDKQIMNMDKMKSMIILVVNIVGCTRKNYSFLHCYIINTTIVSVHQRSLPIKELQCNDTN